MLVTFDTQYLISERLSCRVGIKIVNSNNMCALYSLHFDDNLSLLTQTYNVHCGHAISIVSRKL